jgi:hypothetical protein
VGESKAQGYDQEYGVLFTEAKTAGPEGNNLFVSMSTIHLSSSSVTNAFVDGNGVYVSIPYKKYMRVEHYDDNNSDNDFDVYMGFYGMVDNRPAYAALVYSPLYRELALTGWGGAWVLRDEGAFSDEIHSIPDEEDWGYPIYPYYPDEITGWNNSSSPRLSGTITITGYNVPYNDIATAINGLSSSPLSVINESPDEYMYSYITSDYIDLEGGVGINSSSNSSLGYLYKESNDFILWGQETLYPHVSSNKGSNPYYLKCEVPSDVGLDLNSNSGTKYYYGSAFNCISFCG